MTTMTGSEPAARVTVQPGDPAPEFALRVSDGRTRRLSEFVGRHPVVLAWFPKAFTGGCTAECRPLSLSSDRLLALDAACFAVGVDDPETNREFEAYLGSDLPSLSEPDKSVARAYGAMTTSGFLARWTFYIGKDGRILAIDKHVRTATHGADIASALDSMKATGPGMTIGVRSIASLPDTKGMRWGRATSTVAPSAACLSQAGGRPPGWSKS